MSPWNFWMRLAPGLCIHSYCSVSSVLCEAVIAAPHVMPCWELCKLLAFMSKLRMEGWGEEGHPLTGIWGCVETKGLLQSPWKVSEKHMGFLTLLY